MSCGPRVGDENPGAYQLEITRGHGQTTGLNTATGGQFLVTKPDGTAVVWAGVLTDVSPAFARLTHLFAPGDLDIPGTYTLEAQLLFPGAVTLCTKYLYVKDVAE